MMGFFGSDLPGRIIFYITRLRFVASLVRRLERILRAKECDSGASSRGNGCCRKKDFGL